MHNRVTPRNREEIATETEPWENLIGRNPTPANSERSHIRSGGTSRFGMTSSAKSASEIDRCIAEEEKFSRMNSGCPNFPHNGLGLNGGMSIALIFQHYLRNYFGIANYFKL